MSRRERGEKKTTYFDYNLLFIIIFLLCFGLVMLFSTSSYTSANKYGDSAHYLKLQLRNILVGLIPMYLFAKIDYHFWKRFGLFAYIGSILLCVMVMLPIPFLVRSSHGKARWLNLGPLSFQPSELAKLAVIIFLAMLLERIPKQLDQFRNVIKVMLMLIPLFVVVAVNNLSTAVIIFAIAGCMLFVASRKVWPFVGIAGAGVGLIAVFIGIADLKDNCNNILTICLYVIQFIISLQSIKEHV